MSLMRASLTAAAGVVLSLAALTSHAAIPYKGHSYEFRQPGGEMLKIRLDGNDYYAEQRTEDGSLVIYDHAKRGFCYAHVNATGDELVSSGVLATNAKLRTFSTAQDKREPGLSTAAKARLAKQRYQKMHGRTLELAQKTTSAMMAPSAAATAAVTGQMRGLTVIIDFSDAPGTITKPQVESFLNDASYTGFGNAQSVRGYFLAASGNKLDYSNTVTRYYRAKRPKSYYTDNSLDVGPRAQELIVEALNWVKSSEGFDFSTLSRDSTGHILGLNFFYAGEADSPWSKGLWPHMGWIGEKFCSNGACTGNYQISDMGKQLAIGTFVHESGHLIMGWPDLYDYDGSSQGSVANFCVMGFGGVGYESQYRPTQPVGFLRYLAGWDTAIELNPAINRSAPTGRLSMAANGHSLYRWSNPANAAEAFYVEAIHKSEQNLYQPDQGLAVFHIDPTGTNDTEWKPYIQMEHADGKRDPENNVNQGDANDLYDGVATRAFNASVPNALTSKGTNSLWWNGYASGFALSNISVPGKTVSFDLGTATPTPAADVYNGTLAEKGEAIHPSPWFEYKGGTLGAVLSGPAGTDFDLRLEQWQNNGTTNLWVNVAESAGDASQEALTFKAPAGYYRIVISSYSGAGKYKLSVTK
ncbi:M6 family metalloprotease domain-containing protein [Massilia violaceinigra]|nr:M6 family metalloprotease domain-containing protein [Massilia violaceinigra]